jgi:hypothetical protein
VHSLADGTTREGPAANSRDPGHVSTTAADAGPCRRDKAHLKFVTSQICLICGRKPSDPHHLRFAQPRALGRKVSDEYRVPLCFSHHRDVHRFGNEVIWWKNARVDPLAAALRLWSKTRVGKSSVQRAAASNQEDHGPAECRAPAIDESKSRPPRRTKQKVDEVTSQPAGTKLRSRKIC